MKVRPYERSTLWRAAFSKTKNDPDERDRQALAEAYRQLRERAGDLVGEIHAVLPQLTVHDLTHADALWDVASEICGPKYTLNPLEAFVLGAGFLLHDAGMALAAYRGGLSELKNSPEYRDAVVAAWKKNGVDDPTTDQRISPDDAIDNEAIFQVLRVRHASQAKVLVTALWTQPATGRTMALVQNDDLLESYGELIGNISASHHWPVTEVARFFGDSTSASAAWPRAWDVDGLALACILRCADACAIDETRAPSFLFALRKPEGASKRHWTFQNKIYPAKRRDDGLVFESKSPFLSNESEDWWLCFDAIAVGDQEFRSSDALLTDRKRQPLAVRRIVGANDPDVLTNTIKVEGWKPVNTQPRISDPQSIIERLGGRQLYGDAPIVPIRELVQNAVDAIRARRFLDPLFRPTPTEKYPGKVLIQIIRIPETQDYWLSVEDNGIGMSERVITGSLLDFGTSFWSSEIAAQLYPGLPSEQSFRPTGKFGIGFFSIFMYSNVAKVVSREFRSALGAWNVLTFAHGIKGRGKFSVEPNCEGITSLDVKTRISIRVDKSFLINLIYSFSGNWVSPEEDTNLFCEEISDALRELVLPLDVRVAFSFQENHEVIINVPLLYEKQRDIVWQELVALMESSRKNVYVITSKNQKEMLIPLGKGDQLFGYCGLNISHNCTILQSIGGLSRLDAMSDEPIWGVAEYFPRAANRIPSTLTAPPEVMADWIEKQITFVKRANLTEAEIQAAIESLMTLKVNLRPVFRIISERGPLGLDDFIGIAGKAKHAIFPVRQRMGPRKEELYYSGLPTVNVGPSSLYLRPEYIEFSNFTIYSDVIGHISEPDLHVATEYTLWGVIICRLEELCLNYEISINPARIIGKYIGLDSAIHGLSSGDEIEAMVIELKIE
jgi:hypothetical protein